MWSEADVGSNLSSVTYLWGCGQTLPLSGPQISPPLNGKRITEYTLLYRPEGLFFLSKGAGGSADTNNQSLPSLGQAPHHWSPELDSFPAFL